jgi:type II secretory pathway pseudopilin PulG
MSVRRPQCLRKKDGLSLFELVIALLVAAILMGIFLERVQFYKLQAEELMVKAVVTNIRTSLRVRTALLISQRDRAGLERLVQLNPMHTLIVPPANYLGEIDEETNASLLAGNWYFRIRDKELVYLLNSGTFVAIEGQKSLNFKVKLLQRPNSPTALRDELSQYRVAFEQVGRLTKIPNL